MKLRCVIVDDEPAARQGLSADVRRIEFMDVAGIAESASRAFELLELEKPDLLFLDIQMPRITGLNLIKMLKSPPMIIITTAYSRYALDGYALDVIDYLVKPVDFNRLLQACNKARHFHELNNAAASKNQVNETFIFVKVNGNLEKIYTHDILFIAAANNYSILHLVTKKIMIYYSLKHIAGMLPQDRFLKVHKSFVIAIDKVTSVNGNSISVKDNLIPISRKLKEVVRKRILNEPS